MSAQWIRKGLLGLGLLVAAWLGVRYVLPVSVPFLLGAVLALAAEPLVSLGVKKCRFSRTLAAGIGVSVTMVLLGAVVLFVGALLVKELGSLAKALPDLQDTAAQGVDLMKSWLTDLADRTPEGVRPLMQRSVEHLFGGGSQVMEQVTRRIPGVVTSVLGWVPDGALGIGTGVLSAFMISARLPKLRQSIAGRIPESWKTRWFPALRRLRRVLGGWLRAQGKLALVTYGIVTAGFLLLRIPYGPAWAALVALVDAVPILGTGTVLVPWAVVSLLQQEHLRAVGLLCVYGAAMMTRTALEPRLVGKHLGIDPLVTLICLYAGYRLWGILGMIAAPVAATAVKSLIQTEG